MVRKGEKVQCIVLSVDPDRKRVALGMKQLEEDPWQQLIPEKYLPGDTVKGKVTKIANFGAFVALEDGVEGLLHISEMAERKVETPEEVVSVDQELYVRILRVDPVSRKIGLSLKRVTVPVPEPEEKTQPVEDKQPETPAPEQTVLPPDQTPSPPEPSGDQQPRDA
jgi:small subunit ribosomal protein S1